MAYGDLDVLKGVDLSVKPGSVTCIIGPSGSGKSTLLRGLNRLVEPKSGDILIDGESILAMKPETLRRRVGMVFQHFNLFPDHTALENVMLSLTKIGIRRQPRPSALPRQGLPMLVLRAASITVRAVFPAGSSSASPLPVRLRWNRKSSFSMR